MTSARRPGATRTVVGLLAVAVASLLSVGPIKADTAGELKSAKEKLHALERQIADEQATIASLQSQARKLARRIDQVQTRMARTQSRMVEVQQQIRAATRASEATQAQLNRRASIAYQNGPGTSLEFLLGSTSLADLSLRLEIVDNAVQSDHDLITSLESQRTGLQQQKEKLRGLEAELRAAQADLQRNNEAILDKLDATKALEAQLEANMRSASGQVDELEQKLEAEEAAAERARLEALRRQQERERQNHSPQVQGGSGGSGGGNWVPGIFQTCPVPGAAYWDDFGAPRYGGGYHPHAGNDMFQSFDAPIYAPFAGSVADATNGLGGIALKVYGADGYVYNAHLSRIAPGVVGASVVAGTLIGFVGDTGDASGGVPHNHFEWHPNVIPPNAWESSTYGVSVIGDAIDPYPYLNSVC